MQNPGWMTVVQIAAGISMSVAELANEAKLQAYWLSKPHGSPRLRGFDRRRGELQLDDHLDNADHHFQPLEGGAANPRAPPPKPSPGATPPWDAGA